MSINIKAYANTDADRLNEDYLCIRVIDKYGKFIGGGVFRFNNRQITYKKETILFNNIPFNFDDPRVHINIFRTLINRKGWDSMTIENVVKQINEIRIIYNNRFSSGLTMLSVFQKLLNK